jgi:hypothetical protein
LQGQVDGFPGCDLGVGALTKTIAEAVMHFERDGVERGLEPGAELDLVGFGGGKQGVFVGDTDWIAQECGVFQTGGRGSSGFC